MCIRKWCREPQQDLETHNIMDIFDDPTRIFNGDESGPRGYRNLYSVKLGKEKENITVLIVFNAAGNIVSPLVIFLLDLLELKVCQTIGSWVNHKRNG